MPAQMALARGCRTQAKADGETRSGRGAAGDSGLVAAVGPNLPLLHDCLHLRLCRKVLPYHARRIGGDDLATAVDVGEVLGEGLQRAAQRFQLGDDNGNRQDVHRAAGAGDAYLRQSSVHVVGR